MGVPVQRNNSGSTSALSELKRIQKIVNDTVRSYLGGGQNTSQMREKQVRCFRTVAHDNTGSGTISYPLYPSNVFAGVMGRPFFKQEPGLQSLEFKPYAGPIVRYLMDPFGNYRVEGEVVFCQLIHGQWFILGGNHEFLFRAKMTAPVRGLPIDSNNDPAEGVYTYSSFTDLRRLPDNAPIPYQNPGALVGSSSIDKGVIVSNSKNHRAPSNAVVYLVKNHVLDTSPVTGTGTANSPFTNNMGTSSDFNAGPDIYFDNVPKQIYLDIIDVPLQAIECVNHMQIVKIEYVGQGQFTIVNSDQSEAGIITYVTQSIMVEYDRQPEEYEKTADGSVRRCPIITFGPCEIVLDADELATLLSGEPEWHNVTIKGDSDMNNPLFNEFRISTECVNSVLVNTGTSTSTATSS